MSERRRKGQAQRHFSQFKAQELLQFWEVRIFTEAWHDLRLTADDLLDLQMEIVFNPARAPVVKGTGGLRKLRFSPEGWPVGKSGALRVCYVYFEEFGEVLLVLVYAKSERDDLTEAEKAAIRGLIARQEAGYARRKRNISPADGGKEKQQ
jgi:hypothetical protein